MSERSGIEIDYCSQCRGVWLDRGELDKILERAAESPAQASQPAQRQPDHRTDPHHPYQHHGKRKKEGFLSDIFDF